MPPKKVLEVRIGSQSSQIWRVSLTEDAFDSILHGGDAIRKVFSEGSLFSPLLYGKFFDPADAFPLWEFESEALLSGIQSSFRDKVQWSETDLGYFLRAQLPEGARKCDVEICGQKVKVVEISGKWRVQEADAKNWKTGRWWEYGYVRRLELPEDANWTKLEACISDDIFLEIKVPKNSSDGNLHRIDAVEPKESEYV